MIGAEQAVRMDCLQLAVQLDREGADTGAMIARAQAFADFVLKGSTSPAQPLAAGLDAQGDGTEAPAFAAAMKCMAEAGAIVASARSQRETAQTDCDPEPGTLGETNALLRGLVVAMRGIEEGVREFARLQYTQPDELEFYRSLGLIPEEGAPSNA
ncbi:hypothetical protein [Azospirillum sp. B506]|uniref:hypothetical protein n=1 Tax=Azospirillum sp. B506 TaxID=137721 RepID=UPI00034DED0E|nr:hypothetical protein [Azospirillum sp. B506]